MSKTQFYIIHSAGTYVTISRTLLCSSLLLDDPYYCGLRARVPNFVKSGKSKDTAGRYPASSISGGMSQPSSMMHQFHQYHPMHHQHHAQQNPVMWHARSFDSGMGVYGDLIVQSGQEAARFVDL